MPSINSEFKTGWWTCKPDEYENTKLPNTIFGRFYLYVARRDAFDTIYISYLCGISVSLHPDRYNFLMEVRVDIFSLRDVSLLRLLRDKTRSSRNDIVEILREKLISIYSSLNLGIEHSMLCQKP